MQSPPSTVHALLAACERRPGHPFLLFEGRSQSFAQVRAAAAAWAVLYHQRGVTPGDRVALFLGNSPEFVAAYLGAHMAGTVVVLVNTQYRQTELRHILSDSAARLLVTEERLLGEIAGVRGELPELSEVVTTDDGQRTDDQRPATKDQGPKAYPERSEGTKDEEPALSEAERSTTTDDRGTMIADLATANRQSSIANRQSSDIAVIGYTSGTTGRSKGAMLTHGNLMANSAAVTAAWRWTEDDRLLLTLPLFHIHGLGVGLHGALLTGSTLDLRRGFVADEVLATLAAGEVTMFFGVPTMYTRLIEEARRGGRVPHVRLFVSGSAALSPQTFTAFEELFGQRILERYGMTETIMNLTNPYDGERRPGTVGVPFPGQEARIVDVRTRTPLPDGETGEIQVRGPHVFAGYWRNPEATAEAFDSEGWFSTGDLGQRSADGYFTISGRARELIISGGYNIYPREVEEVLLAHPQVVEAAVLGMPDAEFGECVVAVLVLAAQSSAEQRATTVELQAELVQWCRERLASYKKPRQVIVVESLPRNALGKVQKHLLKESLHDQRS